MDEQFIRDRITSLRIAANKSEREMNLDLGHSPSYINSIASGRSIPSMREFLYICEYLHITPESFFYDTKKLSSDTSRVVNLFEKLDESDQKIVIGLLIRLTNR